MQPTGINLPVRVHTYFSAGRNKIPLRHPDAYTEPCRVGRDAQVKIKEAVNEQAAAGKRCAQLNPPANTVQPPFLILKRAAKKNDQRAKNQEPAHQA